MGTQRIQMKTVEEQMTGYTPIYSPIYPLLINGKARQYDAKVGQMNFKRATTVGDIRGKRITPKDTVMQRIAVADATRAYKKYFDANQYVSSSLQDQDEVSDVVQEVLDEHQKAYDELVLFGGGTSSGNVVNNGLYYSADPYYTTESEGAISGSGDAKLTDLHDTFLVDATKANALSGNKLAIFFGTSLLPIYNGVYASAVKPFKTVLGEVLGSDYTLAQLPADVTPSGDDGWLIVNMDQVRLHYAALPSLLDQGYDARNMEYWFNFMYGSSMLEVLAKNGVIHRQVAVS